MRARSTEHAALQATQHVQRISITEQLALIRGSAQVIWSAVNYTAMCCLGM